MIFTVLRVRVWRKAWNVLFNLNGWVVRGVFITKGADDVFILNIFLFKREQCFQIRFDTINSPGRILCRGRSTLMNKKINMPSLKWCGGPFVFFKAIDDYCFDSSKKTLHWTICVISLNHRHSQEDVLSKEAGVCGIAFLGRSSIQKNIHFLLQEVKLPGIYPSNFETAVFLQVSCCRGRTLLFCSAVSWSDLKTWFREFLLAVCCRNNNLFLKASDNWF